MLGGRGRVIPIRFARRDEKSHGRLDVLPSPQHRPLLSTVWFIEWAGSAISGDRVCKVSTCLVCVDESEDALFPERLIDSTTVVPTVGGFEADLRLPWYRALPLSCVERIDVKVDGQPVPISDVSFSLGAHGPYSFEELAELTDTYWYVLDSARLRVTSEPATTPGSHEISVGFGLYIPYLPVNGAPLKNLDSCTATLEVPTR